MGRIEIKIGNTHIIEDYTTTLIGSTLFVDCSALIIRPVERINTTLVLK
jgi:hypothetical protein